jgi:hypothetical protein
MIAAVTAEGLGRANGGVLRDQQQANQHHRQQGEHTPYVVAWARSAAKPLDGEAECREPRAERQRRDDDICGRRTIFF